MEQLSIRATISHIKEHLTTGAIHVIVDVCKKIFRCMRKRISRTKTQTTVCAFLTCMLFVDSR